MRAAAVVSLFFSWLSFSLFLSLNLLVRNDCQILFLLAFSVAPATYFFFYIIIVIVLADIF